MTFELGTLFAAVVLYLGLLFIVAYAADNGWLPQRLIRHPLTYTLSLGVYATSWTYYGSVGFAQAQGYSYLTIYLGVTLAFVLAPLLLEPIQRLTREYQLGSLADLFAFRYRSQWAGALVTLFMLVGVLPYISLQIRAVTESVQVLSGESAPRTLAFGFCLVLILFSMLFGARHVAPREKHDGLVAAIAFESAVKLVALLAVGAFALFGVFGGPGGLGEWLRLHPEALDRLYRPVREGPWGTLLLLSFSAAFLLPRQFHMIFTENASGRGLRVASWGFPLYLLALNLPILPILWAGSKLVPGSDADYYVLGITLGGGDGLLTMLAFLGGVSASSAMVIVTTLALAGMCLNHLILPRTFGGRSEPYPDLYRWLLWGRRVLILVIILAGYGFYTLAEQRQGLVQIGLISFVAVAQFLPGIAGLLIWPRATRAGFIAGLLGGAVVWGYTLILPLLARGDLVTLYFDPLLTFDLAGASEWTLATFWSLAINALFFVGVSLLTRPDAGEQEAARACCRETVSPPSGRVFAASPSQFRERLAPIVGTATAEKEVARALDDLGMSPEERRPTELRMLRERIERNLSGLVGPMLARMVVDDRLHMDTEARIALADTMRFMEKRLDTSQSRLRGLAAELDGLRRYHRRVLQGLPLGVCSLGPHEEVVLWNLTLEELSGVVVERASGKRLVELPEPWGGLLGSFLHSEEPQLYKLQLHVRGVERWFNLYKAAISDPDLREPGGVVILVEDLTELYTLESELAHSERLASIGRLAAGVAHEVGNPLTGIASLAQNLKGESDLGFIQQSVDLILTQTRRIRDIVQSLVSFSHAGLSAERARGPVSIAECVEEAMRLVSLSREGKRLTWVADFPRDVVVLGDRQRLIQVFLNLLSNAGDASHAGDRVEVSGYAEEGFAFISVRDEGEGIPVEVQGRVFEPFFTTKEPGKGTGLGLPLVYNIVHDHAGSIRLKSVPGAGTQFTLRLPLAE